MYYNTKFILTCIIILMLNMSLIGCTNKPPEQPLHDKAGDQTIIDEWKTVPIPPAPELKPVTVESKSTALLILDMQNSLCQYPRSIDSIAKIATLLAKAREKGMLVIYSLTSAGNSSDIVSQLAPTPDTLMVKSSVDKFFNTDLDKILRDHGITTVIITGTVANGAVLNTATGAALRGYKVIVPVEGMSSKEPYVEQYTAWHLVNSPGTRGKTTLTKVSLISF